MPSVGILNKFLLHLKSLKNELLKYLPKSAKVDDKKNLNFIHCQNGCSPNHNLTIAYIDSGYLKMETFPSYFDYMKTWKIIPGNKIVIKNIIYACGSVCPNKAVEVRQDLFD